MKRVIWCVLLLVCAGCFASVPPVPKNPSEVTGGPPEILDSFTFSRIPSNRILPIFLDARDPDGDLVGFWVTVSQLGGNMFSPHYIPIKQGKVSRIEGFLTLNIPRLYDIEYLRIEIVAVDEEGNKSDRVVHSVEIGMVSSVKEKVPERWRKAEQKRIGHIFFDFERDHEGKEDILLRR